MTTASNKIFNEVVECDIASIYLTLHVGDVRAWSAAFGESNVFSDLGESQVAAGIITVMLSALVWSDLPGPGSVVRAVSVQVNSGLPIDVAMAVRVVVREKRTEQGIVVLDGLCTDPAGRVIVTATLEVLAPTTHQHHQVAELRIEGLIERCKNLKPTLTGVVHPCRIDALTGAVEAADSGLILPMFYGPETGIWKIADKADLDIHKHTIVATENAEESALLAAMAAVFLHPALQKEISLRRGRLISHCTMMSVPTYARRIIASDVGLNIAPNTDQKRHICQNAIGFGRALGIDVPKVAVLAAIEMVNTKMSATLDGAILSELADRRQIVGGIVDGPLDLDAAVDVDAVRIKHIKSPIAGLPDILIVPNIEAGNMICKSLAFMADAQTAGLVVGTPVPVILTNRADTTAARRFSAAAAVRYADALTRDPTILHPEVVE